MNAVEMNPYIRYMDLRRGTMSYETPVKAYDYRLFYAVEGECVAETENKPFVLKPGSCLIIPPGHAYRMVFDTPATLYNINFSLSYLPGNGEPLRPDTPQRFIPSQMPEAPDPFFFPVPTLVENVPQVQETAAAILNERERRAMYFDEISSAMLKSLLLGLVRQPKVGDKPVPSVVVQLKKYLREHCREPLTGEELGKRFGYHPFSLNRIFRRYTSQTIHFYQMRCRMREGCELLATTDLSIKEIADHLGFSSPSYFSETFKKLRGITPVEYRNGIR